jgi:transposase-like protein
MLMRFAWLSTVKFIGFGKLLTRTVMKSISLQKKRNAKAAMRFFKRLLLKLGKAPRVLVTDKLRSYRKAKRILLPNTEHRSYRRLNNRIENSHQPTREKERQMRKLKHPGSAQRFLSLMGTILNPRPSESWGCHRNLEIFNVHHSALYQSPEIQP